MVRDDVDRRLLLDLLRDSSERHGVALHAYALLDARLDLVATPRDRDGLSLMMQAVARRHAAAYNRRHNRQGGLWQGRFRAAVLDPGHWLLRCMLQVERSAEGAIWASRAVGPPLAEAPQLVDPAVFWNLGNTPFEREVAYRSLKEQGLTPEEMLQIEAALRGGWVLGPEPFAAQLAELASRPAKPRARGRPRSTTVG